MKMMDSKGIEGGKKRRRRRRCRGMSSIGWKKVVKMMEEELEEKYK